MPYQERQHTQKVDNYCIQKIPFSNLTKLLLLGLIISLFSDCRESKKRNEVFIADSSWLESSHLSFHLILDTFRINNTYDTVPIELYNLSKTDVNNLEHLLQQISSKNHLQPDSLFGLRSLETYHIQVFPYKVRTTKFVELRASCRFDDIDGEEHLLMVHDGGNCYWQGILNLSYPRVDYFMINNI